MAHRKGQQDGADGWTTGEEDNIQARTSPRARYGKNREDGAPSSDEETQSPQPKAFPTFRARAAMLAIMFCFQMNGYSVPTLSAQYFHHRFHSDYFNDTTDSTANDSSSNCYSNGSSPVERLEAELQERVADLQMYMSYAMIGPMIIATVVLGSMSDFLGRRFLFLLPCSTAFIKQVIGLAAMRLNLPLWLFYVANVVDGLSGSFCTLFLAAFAYTADLTPPDKPRTFGIALAEFSLNIANVASELSVGFLLQNFGFFYGSLFPTAFVACAVLIAYFALPETVPASQRSRSCRLNPVKYFKNVSSFYLTEGSRRQRAKFCLLLLVLFLYLGSSMDHEGILTLYQLNLPFCWSAQQVGVYAAVEEAITAVLSLVAVHVLQKWLSDPVLLLLGMASTATEYVVEGLATTSFMLWAAVAAGCLSYVNAPVNRAALSKMAESDKQGALFASIALMETISTLVSSTMFNAVYAATVAHVRGAVFFVMAGIISLDCLLVLVFSYVAKTGPQTYDRFTGEPKSAPPDEKSATDSCNHSQSTRL